jgi:hypothetical protein
MNSGESQAWAAAPATADTGGGVHRALREDRR